MSFTPFSCLNIPSFVLVIALRSVRFFIPVRDLIPPQFPPVSRLDPALHKGFKVFSFDQMVFPAEFVRF